MLSDNLLAPNWKWSRRKPYKVRKSGGTYIEYTGGVCKIQGGRGTGIHGSFHMEPNAYPHIVMIILTYYEDEIKSRIRDIL